MNAQTEKLLLQGADGAVEALRDLPAADVAPAGVAVIAHPHPLFGGTMDNKVVQTLARAFVACGWTAVRFN
ncbi:MAG: alpha/beta hydrolase, partial [Comamonadaceae bacterium]